MARSAPEVKEGLCATKGARIREIKALRDSWRLNELGSVSRRQTDLFAIAIDDLFEEITRRNTSLDGD